MNTNFTILVVDDDRKIRDLLRASLETEQFKVLEAGDSDQLYRLLKSEQVDLITMDVALGRENGMDLLKDIRKLNNVPVIFITGRTDLVDTVVGLELGADDYITKPFQIRELIARVRSLLRRSKASAENQQATPEGGNLPEDWTKSAPATDQISLGRLSIDTAARELCNADGEAIAVTTTEYDLLMIFVNSPQRVLSREQLMEQLTGREWHPSDRIIDNHVAKLRKKIEQYNGGVNIKTIRGAGYMLSSKPGDDTLQLIDDAE